MQIEAKVTRVFTLTLTEDEVRWLRDFTQNTLIEDESQKSIEHRKALFESCKNILALSK